MVHSISTSYPKFGGKVGRLTPPSKSRVNKATCTYLQLVYLGLLIYQWPGSGQVPDLSIISQWGNIEILPNRLVSDSDLNRKWIRIKWFSLGSWIESNHIIHIRLNHELNRIAWFMAAWIMCQSMNHVKLIRMLHNYLESIQTMMESNKLTNIPLEYFHQYQYLNKLISLTSKVRTISPQNII